MVAPQLLPETLMIEREGKFLFLVPSKPDWIVTNSNGAFLLSLCKGELEIHQVVELAKAKGIDASESAPFLETVTISGFFKASEPRKISNNESNRILKSVHLNMHKDCNLECNYCYAEERERSGAPLTREEYIKIIDDLTAFACCLNIEFTGGEPLLNKGTIEIAAYAKSLGHTTRLLSNAIPITVANAECIANAFDNVRISIDGSTSELNDFHRGEGTYKKIMNSIELLDKQNASITLAMTVTKKNIEDIPAMAKKFGNRLTFQPLFNAGSAKLNKELAITGDEYYSALSNSGGVTPMGGLGESLNRLKNRGTVKCALGDSEISLSHDGNVYPCHMLHSEEFSAGNVREKSIQEIYMKSPALTSTQNLNVYARAECSECAVRLLCGGSCRARAYYLAGDINACDDFCDYEFSAYINGIFQSADI